MKICVTSKGKEPDAAVDPRFGRCKYFMIIDLDSMKSESISNESMMASGGAGIQAAQLVAKTGVEMVLTGNIGPNAFQTLRAAGIKVITGIQGTITEVVEKYKTGELHEIDTPTVRSHHGLKNKWR